MEHTPSAVEVLLGVTLPVTLCWWHSCLLWQQQQDTNNCCMPQACSLLLQYSSLLRRRDILAARRGNFEWTDTLAKRTWREEVKPPKVLQ